MKSNVAVAIILGPVIYLVHHHPVRIGIRESKHQFGYQVDYNILPPIRSDLKMQVIFVL
jgi:mannose/fructose/N-acetylgalactosamine-specific phosphotransferase system component IID